MLTAVQVAELLAFLGEGFPDGHPYAPLVAALARAGITTPFPIQAATLPDALAGLDILGRGRTGSGKTLGFALPLVAGLSGGHTMAGRPRGLVLVPTRELASQVQAVLAPLADVMGLSTTAIFGGTPQNPQVAALLGDEEPCARRTPHHRGRRRQPVRHGRVDEPRRRRDRAGAAREREHAQCGQEEDGGPAHRQEG